THALREEGDTVAFWLPITLLAISTHALREEGDAGSIAGNPISSYFYPRPPRGGRPASPRRRGFDHNFYPRPPRGGRLRIAPTNRWYHAFLPTPSARRATLNCAHS